MKFLRALLLVAIVFPLTGMICESKGQNLSKKKAELITSQVDSAFQRMLVYAEDLNFDALSLGVDDTPEAGFISGGRYYSTYASLVKRMESQAQGIARQQISIGEKKITALADAIVLLTATGQATAFASDGRQIKANFDWSFIYQQVGNDWKVIYSHQSVSQSNP